MIAANGTFPGRQWGASVGGAIRKERTFYFLNYEGSHQERGAFIQSPQPSFFVGNLNEHYALARLDHRWNERQWLSWRTNGYLFNGNNLNDRVAGFNQPSFGRETKTQSLGSQATLHSLVGPVFNELRLSFVTYVPDSAFPLQSSVGVNRPNYSVEGYSTNNWVHSQTYNIGDVGAVRKGRHEWKAGFDYLRQRVQDYSFTPLGSYTFAAGTPAANPNPLRFSQNIRRSRLPLRANGRGWLRTGRRASAAAPHLECRPALRVSIDYARQE